MYMYICMCASLVAHSCLHSRIRLLSRHREPSLPFCLLLSVRPRVSFRSDVLAPLRACRRNTASCVLSFPQLSGMP